MSIAELSRRYGTEVLRRGARRDPELYVSTYLASYTNTYTWYLLC